MNIVVDGLELIFNDNEVLLKLSKKYAKHIKYYLNTKYIVITIGKFENHKSCEILFEDYSDAPRVLRADFSTQVKENYQFEDNSSSIMYILCDDVKRGEIDVYIRYRDTLPCMERL